MLIGIYREKYKMHEPAINNRLRLSVGVAMNTHGEFSVARLTDGA